MADVDIGEELLKAVRADFRKELGDNDSKLAKILKRIQNGKGTMHDTALFAKECGAALSEAIAKNVTPDRLPNGQLYYNIADTILRTTLKDNYDLVNMVAQAAQEQTDSKLNIHLAPQQALFPEDRIHKIINGAADQTADSDTIKRRLDAPVRNVTESFYDDFVEENAEFRDEAGLKTYLVRQTKGKCCDWCASLAGRYLYEDAPEEVFAKHDNCTCTVEYITDKYRENVHTKKRYALTPVERMRILAKAPKPTRFTKEQAENLQFQVLNGVANSGGSGIIKSIDVDDYELVTYGKNINSEVSNVILSTMRQCENKGGFVISEISTDVTTTSTNGTAVLQIEPMSNGLLKLNINAKFLSGKTLQEINDIFAHSDNTVVNSLQEAVIHESGHAISIKGKSLGEIAALYDELGKIHLDGVSKIARDDGAECLAELEVLRSREAPVSKELGELYNKYMGRKYK